MQQIKTIFLLHCWWCKVIRNLTGIEKRKAWPGLIRDSLNRNPDRLVEMKETLPLLSQKKYYKDLRCGYAHPQSR